TPRPPTYALTGAPEVVEGNPLVFTLALSEATGTNTVFKLATVNGTATGGSDFETSHFEYSTNGGGTWLPATRAGFDEATILAGATSILIRVDTTNDLAKETTPESMQLTVSSIVSGTVAATGNDGTETGQIDDNDNHAPVGVTDRIFINGPS